MKRFFRDSVRLLTSMLMLGVIIYLSACDNDDNGGDPDPMPGNIVEIAQENGFTVLAAALQAADLVTTLQGDGPFTVFAPTDAAFNAAGLNAQNIGDIPGLADILTYHVIGDEITSAQLTNGERATVNGQNINIDADNLTINGDVNIVNPFDVDASNGVIHTIDGVLLPPLFDIVITALRVDGEFNTLAAALTEADLIETLQGDGPFTVFAPTDAAFAAMDPSITPANVGDVENLEEILLYHVVPGTFRSGDLEDGPATTANAGKQVEIAVDGSNITVDGISVIAPFDVDATNGVIHTIEGVLMPRPNVVELASANDNFSSLVAALGRFEDLETLLSDETQRITVFAPDNTAFDALLGAVSPDPANPVDLDTIPDNVLRRVLEYHVIPGAAVLSTALNDGDTPATALAADGGGNETVTVSKSGSEVRIDNILVTGADLPTSNGVVHVIEGVLAPSTEALVLNTIVETAYFNKAFTTLTTAVVEAGLLTNLVETPNLTLFAPTNDAFEAAGISGAALNELLQDQDSLQAILNYHVLGTVVTAENLPATGSAVPTSNGDFYLSITNDEVFINGVSQVIATNLDPDPDMDNSIVHVIDRTLVPPAGSIVDIAVAASNAEEGAQFGQLVAALARVSNNGGADLVTTLDGDGDFTVFAPTDQAFQDLYDALGDGVNGVDDISVANLETVLTYHVIAGTRAFSTDLPNILMGTSGDLPTFQGSNITVDLSNLTITEIDAVLMVDDNNVANIIDTNILATNGVIHVIDKVILP